MNSPARITGRRLALVPALLIALLLTALLAACSSGSQDSSSGSSSASSADTGSGSTSASGGIADSRPQGFSASSDAGATRATVQTRQVVSTGSVSLSSKDVAGVRSEVDRLLTTYDGFLADEQTRTDRRGRPDHTTLTLRVPAKDFDTVMHRLAGLATLRDSSRKAEDVTTTVIDVDQQITAQQVGLRRLEQLLKTSGSLRDLLAVEQQVTDRRAALDSLVQQRAYLADQTSLATITLTVDQTGAAAPVQAGGFLGGLSAGWSALLAVLGGLLSGAGALLPFALVGLVLWLPVRWVVRRLRPARPIEEDAQPAGS